MIQIIILLNFPKDAFYILKYRNPIPCPNVMKWAKWYKQIRFRRVRLTLINDCIRFRRVRLTLINDCKVSTVFLCLSNFRVDANNKPLLFETMIFYQGKSLKVGEQVESLPVNVCSTWRSALSNHKIGVILANSISL